MYGYTYFMGSRHMYDAQRGGSRSPYQFERDQTEDSEASSGVGSTIAVLAALVLVGVVLVVLTLVGQSGDQGTTDQAIRVPGHGCTRATGLWSGCLPSK